ncbi:MAG TPA: hypothetical protein VKH61_05270, partial [Streptosporangiaceae bacterium]|nr:hypothetical protein [Streptosporangiaceae bacterium]
SLPASLHNEVVINEAEVRGMSLDERRRLARLLAELESADPGPLANPYLTDAKLRRQRRLALLVSAGCCVVLAVWIVVIAATLPRHFDAHHWRGVWVNFDVFLLAAFAATAWAIWRERQILILLLVGIGTMLCCDAWFDVGTSLATSDLWISLLSAVFAELPLAFLAFVGARRLLRATVDASLQVPAPAAQALGTAQAGTRGRADDLTCSLRRTSLSGNGLDEALPPGRAQRTAEQHA